MRRTQLVVVAAATMFSAAPAHARKWEAIEKLPKHSPVNVIVQENGRLYFRVTAQEPLPLVLEGPLRLRIVSRAELGSDPKEIVTYQLRVSEAGKLLDEQSTESSASEEAYLADGKRPVCKSRQIIVDVPTGKRQLQITVEGAAAVLVRLMQGAPSHGEQSMVSLTPVEAARSVLLTEGEKTIPYYSVLPGKPVRLRVVGPTKLDLMLRLDFDATMRGSQSYRVTIADGQRQLREARFMTTKATTATYSDLTDRVPSKFDRVQLDLDSGVHDITLTLIEPEHGSVEVHAQIPQPTVGDSE